MKTQKASVLQSLAHGQLDPWTHLDLPQSSRLCQDGRIPPPTPYLYDCLERQLVVINS